MIDLSFLTEEEQETIMKVLQRDAVLKRVEEERVRCPRDTSNSIHTESQNYMEDSAAWNSRSQENTEGGQNKSLSQSGKVEEAGLQNTHNSVEVEGTKGTRSNPVFTTPTS